MFACTPCADTIGMDPGHEVFSLHNVVAVEAL